MIIRSEYISVELKNFSDHFKISKLKLWLNVCDSIFIINCIESFFLKNKNIVSVVLNSDVHKISRSFVFYCKKHNIHTYVLQHGAPVGHFGYLPVYADNMFNWGSYSYNWFVKNKTSKQKLIITGTPKTDNIYPCELKDVDLKCRRVSLLLVLNPIGESLCRLFLKTIYDAIKTSTSNYKVVIKLHPSSNSYKNLPSEILEGISYQIFHLHDLHSLIKESDIVISTPSTAGSEVIALHKPLLTMIFSEIKYKLAYELYDCDIKFYDVNSLLECLENKEKLTSRMSSYNKFINDYFYKLDGSASDRIKSYITDEK